MPRLTMHPPGMGQIYAAFHPASMAVFQAAMAVSCGGVVRITDVQAALANGVAEVAGEQVPPQWRNSCRPPEGVASQPRPTANEPALREMLQAAYALAEAQQPESPVITPQILWATALARAGGPHLSAAEVLRQFARPRSSREEQAPCVERAPRVTTQPSPSSCQSPCPTQIHRMDEIFDKWLQLQRMPTGAERQHARARLAPLTTEFERSSRA